MNTILWFLVGVFFANGIPHFVHGISGRKFPTPFAKPPGKGLSPSVVNVLWGLFNFLIAGILFAIAGDLAFGLNAGFIGLVIGFAITSIGLSVVFQSAERDV